MTNNSQNEELNTEFKGVELEKAVVLLNLHDLPLTEIGNISPNGGIYHEFNMNGHDYLVLNDNERDEVATDYIKDYLWAFNSEFLAEQTDLSLLPVFEALVKANLCESANGAILAIIEKFSTVKDFVNSVVNADGYGHFIAQYDGEESEVDGYFIYQIN